MIIGRVAADRLDGPELTQHGDGGRQVGDEADGLGLGEAIASGQAGPVLEAAGDLGEDRLGQDDLEPAVQPGCEDLAGGAAARQKGADQDRAIEDRLHDAPGGLS